MTIIHYPMHTVVSMGRVVRQADVGGRLRLVVLDTLGREFALYFETSEELLDITLVRLPEGVEWRVDTFQEMVGVRDEAYEYLQNDGHSLSDFCLNLEDVVLYEDDPYAEQ